MQKYKLTLIGDGNSGKSSFARRLLNGQFQNSYVPTLGFDVYPITFNNITFDIWDTAGQDQFGGLKERYYVKSDACIVFYTKNSDHLKTDQELYKFIQYNSNAEIIIVWSKCDLLEENNYFESMQDNYLKRYKNFPVYQISSKSMYNIFKPFEVLNQTI